MEGKEKIIRIIKSPRAWEEEQEVEEQVEEEEEEEEA